MIWYQSESKQVSDLLYMDEMTMADGMIWIPALKCEYKGSPQDIGMRSDLLAEQKSMVFIARYTGDIWADR